MIDMAYSITLAHSRGMLTDAMRDEWFTLATQVGLSIDHPQFDAKLLQLSTRAIEKVSRRCLLSRLSRHVLTLLLASNRPETESRGSLFPMASSESALS